MKISVLTVFLSLLLVSCNFKNAKLKTNTNYTGNKLDNVFVVVVSDEDTKACLDYYKAFLIDSLNSSLVKTEGAYFCCRNASTDMQAVMQSLVPKESSYKAVLTIVSSRTTIGHGTSSSRQLEVGLFDLEKSVTTWKGTLSVNFSWFISDANYRGVAQDLTKATLKELRKKSII